LIPSDHLGEFINRLDDVRSGNPIHQLETVRWRKDGSYIDVSLSISSVRDAGKSVIGLADISRDITQRRLAERALRQADKLATTGRLAAAIAHEINNPLESLTNLLYLLLSHPTLDETARFYAQTAEEELNRTAYITRQMLSFHRSADSPLPVNVGKILDSVVDLYMPLIQSQAISIVRNYETNATVEGVPGELKQVFSNLLRNAIEAAGEGGKVRLHVYVSQDWRNPERRGVRIVIADNGHGIPAGLRSRIFDPFFTTKGEGGTGLGLWVGVGILQKRNGSIRFRSNSDSGRSGTVFSVFLPFGSIVTDSRVQAAD
ncbi:MAG TPA: ATP-binding protein, partial [Terriglobales bacterium]|nr:ATP-binding protein [Terriglobales bacterium]